MRITKEADIGTGAVLDATELGLIHALSRRELKAEEVYTFCVRLCDNEIDRDGERFPAETLGELARLFVGKSGMFDHQWSARGQTARIYRTELVRESGLTRAGDAYCYLKGYAYMLRSEKNRELIEEIEGGIKKEVSVSCAVERAVCSICGEEFRDREACAHVKGREYEGKLCWVDLVGATDAYEWSFVAVPAQRLAGVVKGYQPEGLWQALKRADPEGAWQEALKGLEQQAAVGRHYLERLRRDTLRLGLMVQEELDGGTLGAIVEKLEVQELEALQESYQKRMEKRLALPVQLPYGGGDGEDAPLDEAAFQI